MKIRLVLTCFLLVSVWNVFSQQNTTTETPAIVKVDSLYREDQFYFAFTYNMLRDTPVGFSKSKFSTGFSAGFLRDMPINKKRTFAIAPGIGLTYNNYNQNIAVTLQDNTPVYTILNSTAVYSKNKFSQLQIEVPIEFRWRTSTFESHKFLRIYGGFKFSYSVYDKSVFTDNEGKVVLTNNKDFNKLTYGAYISSGYNTLNVYAYYGLNALFKSGKVGDEALQMKALNVGVIFYIL